jgi:phenylacetate-coenzyme A ligase PaaK-like adenylate-forming protein
VSEVTVAVIDDGLEPTLAHARSTLPYYRALFAERDGQIGLEDFPVIDADLVSACPEQFYNLDRFPDFILTTGGTTGRDASFLPVKYEEVDLAFRSRLAAWPRRFFAPEEFTGFVLNLVDLQHGLILPLGHGQPAVSLPLEVGRHFALVVRFLQEGLVINGCRYRVVALFGSTTKLRALTAFCRAQRMPGPEFGVKRITTAAFHASSSWTRRIREYWAADMVTAYGLTEFAEAATVECSACGGFHLPGTVHVEYLAPSTATPVSAGPARLVLTSVYPFRKTMPLIRFDTGDLVEVLPPCPLTLSVGFRFHGRRDGVLLGDKGDVLLTSLDVLDAVDELEDAIPGSICYDDAVPLVMSWGSGHDASAFRNTGYPALHCEVQQGLAGAVLHVTVEVEERSAGRDELARDLRDLLIKTQATRTGTGTHTTREPVDVQCVAPGGLSERRLRLTMI